MFMSPKTACYDWEEGWFKPLAGLQNIKNSYKTLSYDVETYSLAYLGALEYAVIAKS